MVAAQKDYDVCMKHLYQHGYRIPQIRSDERGAGTTEGEREGIRLRTIMEDPLEEEEVETFLTI